MRGIVLFLALLLTTPTPAEDNPIAHAHDPAPVAARPPRPGEWLEYRLSFPVDPLENSLRSDPAPIQEDSLRRRGREQTVEVDGETFLKPSFEPAIAWRTLPLRLEITAVDSLGFDAYMTFAGQRQPFRFPIKGALPGSEFHYDQPQEPEQQGVFSIGGVDYEATATSRRTDRYGFVRLAGEEPPFGLFRFASEHVDLILVGMGQGMPPPFPLELEKAIAPPPGYLYEPEPREAGTYDAIIDETAQ